MGEAPPRSILIVPLKLEEEVLGVAELASFHIFNQHEIEFVEKIGQTIASTITSVKINARTAKLLEQSQKQAEEMAEQEEEMRQNMEELRTTQEDFGRREAEISGFLTAVQNSSLIMVFDDSGKIIDTNDKMLDLLHSNREDLLGRYHRELTTMARNGDELDKFWNELKAGRTRSVVEKIKLPDGKEIYLKQTFSPVTDNNGFLIKVLCISNDISDIRVNELKLEEKSKEYDKLNKDFNLLNEAIDGSLVRCEYSVEGRILEVNDNYCKITGHARTELVGKISTIYLKEEEKIQFEKIWNEVIKDKPYTGSLKRSKPTGEEIWLMSSFVPVKDEEGIVTKVFFLALDITERKLKYSLLEEANKEIERLRKEKGQE
jgi:PAS domain S-box-containing protein